MKTPKTLSFPWFLAPRIPEGLTFQNRFLRWSWIGIQGSKSPKEWDRDHVSMACQYPRFYLTQENTWVEVELGMEGREM